MLLCFAGIAGIAGIAVWIRRRKKIKKLNDANRRYKTGGQEKEGERDGFAKQPSMDGPAQFHNTDFKNKVTQFTHCMKTISTMLEWCKASVG